jgi:hypothetical protein
VTREFWDFDERELAWNPDKSLAAASWVDGQRASGGEYDTTYKWAVWNAATGEELACGYCTHTGGLWGESGETLEEVGWENGVFVVTTSEGTKRPSIPKPSGKAMPGDQIIFMSFYGNRLGEELVVQIASGSAFRRLTELDLRGNKIGAKGAQALAESTQLRRLEALHVLESDAPKKAIAALKKRFGDKLKVWIGSVPMKDDERPFWTGEEYRAALAAVAKALRDETYDTAEQHSGGPHPAFVVFLPGAKLVPRDPTTSFTIEPAPAKQGSIVSVEALTLHCARHLGDRARKILERLQEAMLAERR